MYDIEYLGSLTRAQQVDEVSAIERVLMTVAQTAEVFPDGLDVIDAPKAVRMIGRKLNAPASIMRDEGEVKKLQDERKAQQKQAAQSMQAEAEGNAMKAMGEGQAAMGEQNERAQSPA